MIASWPGTIPEGRTSDHPWAHWDLLPTLADVGGAPIPPGLDGIPMTRALRGERQSPHQYMYWEFHERGFQQAVRMGDWKAVRLKREQPLELYDLSADPAEEKDVASSHPAVVETIERYLKIARTPSERWPGTK
jgi:arylsulfatase A-like enzyme